MVLSSVSPISDWLSPAGYKAGLWFSDCFNYGTARTHCQKNLAAAYGIYLEHVEDRRSRISEIS